MGWTWTLTRTTDPAVRGMVWCWSTHRTCSPDSRSPVCSTTPASRRTCRGEAAARSGSGYTLRTDVTFSCSLRTSTTTLSGILTADFLWAAAGVVGQADHHLSCSMALRQRRVGAVVLHGRDGVVVAAVHAAGVVGGLPHLAVGARSPRAVGAGCRQKAQLRGGSDLPGF